MHGREERRDEKEEGTIRNLVSPTLILLECA